MLRPLLLALQFLTTIPVRLPGQVTPRALARSTAWFSLVGLMLGAVLALVDTGVRTLAPPATSAALVLLIWVALTGALHFDGFLDCCDGLLGAHEPKRRLEIMRDTRVGAFAVAGGVCLLLLKFAALADLPDDRRTEALLVVPALTRAVMVFAMRTYPYARSGPGLGGLYRDELTWHQVAVAGILAVGAAALVMGLAGLALAAWVWLVTVAIAWLVRRRIPGLTGDVYGAINELTEAGALLFVVVVGRIW